MMELVEDNRARGGDHRRDGRKRQGRPLGSIAEYALIAGILLLSLALRFHRLDAQSLWNDEGTTVQLVRADLATITRLAAADIHPPLYYYALRLWTGLFGYSEFAVRSLSVLQGTILVGLVFILGKRLFGYSVAAIAALLSAISPLQVYYSQEARMYTQLALLGAASMLLFLRASMWRNGEETDSGRPEWATAAGYVLASAAALYTHYFAFSLLLAQNLICLVAFIRDLRTPGGSKTGTLVKRVTCWAGLQIAVALLYAPWLLVAWHQIGSWHAVSEPFGLVWMLRETLLVLGLGITVESNVLCWLAVALLGSLAVLGWIDRVRSKSGADLDGGILALLYCGVPVLAMYVVSRRRPMWNPKFLMLATPGFQLLVARGVTAVTSLCGRASRIVLASVLILSTGVSGYSLMNLYYDPCYARDDYRGVVRYIDSMSRAGDALLINAPSQIETVAYYYKGNLPMYPLPRHRPLRRDETVSDLQHIVATHDRVFAIFWATGQSDKERFIEGWLDQRTYKALDRWYGDIRLVVYSIPQDPPTEISHRLDVVLGDSIRLLGYALPSRDVRPGDVLQISLFWEATRPIPRRYKVFVHLLGEDGRIVAQRDAEPGGGVRLTTTWPPGETILDNYGILVPMDAVPGKHRLAIGMYHIEDATRLPVSVGGEAVGDTLLVDGITIR